MSFQFNPPVRHYIGCGVLANWPKRQNAESAKGLWRTGILRQISGIDTTARFQSAVNSNLPVTRRYPIQKRGPGELKNHTVKRSTNNRRKIAKPSND